MPISIAGSGTITGISAGGLPDGVITTDDIAASAVTSAKLAAGAGGKILQVVSATSSTQVSTTSDSYVTSGLSASITPSSSSNKVLITIATPVSRGTGNSNNGLLAAIYKNGSVLQDYGLPMIWTNTDINFRHMLNFSNIDSPATTSSITYALYFASNVAGQTMNVQASNRQGTIILMEVAA